MNSEEEDIVFRLRRRAEIRRQITTRKSVQEGKPDRIADLLEEAAKEISDLRTQISALSTKHPELGFCCGDSGKHSFYCAKSGWKTGRHKGKNGCGRWIRWDYDDRIIDREADECYIICPHCKNKFVLGIGGGLDF